MKTGTMTAVVANIERLVPPRCRRQLLLRPTDKIIAAGIENAKRFSWDQSYQQVKKAYENIYYNHHL